MSGNKKCFPFVYYDMKWYSVNRGNKPVASVRNEFFEEIKMVTVQEKDFNMMVAELEAQEMTYVFGNKGTSLCICGSGRSHKEGEHPMEIMEKALGQKMTNLVVTMSCYSCGDKHRGFFCFVTKHERGCAKVPDVIKVLREFVLRKYIELE